jgi:hypothetical protein
LSLTGRNYHLAESAAAELWAFLAGNALATLELQRRTMKRLITVSVALALAVACNKEPQVQGNAFVSGSAPQPASSGEGSGARLVPTSGTSAPGTAAGASTPTDANSSAFANYREVTLPAGTVLPVDLETAVGSDTSRVEQAVQGRLRRSVSSGGVEVLPVGTAVSGHVTSVQRPGKVKGRGFIALRFTQLDTPGAGSTRINTATISRMAPATKQKDTLKIVAPAAAGAVIGRIAGGKGAARKGAVIGGAAGTGYVLSTRGEEVHIGKGANLAVKLTAPLTVRVPVKG